MLILFLVLTQLIFLATDDQDEVTHLGPVEDCLEHPKIVNSVTADLRMNPYYLRGDFDGDGRPDVAISVTKSKTKEIALLVCTATSRIVLDAKALSPTDPEASVFSSLWRVATKSEVLRLQKEKGRFSTPKGESIMMVWEDGSHLIYWDGKRFKLSPPFD